MSQIIGRMKLEKSYWRLPINIRLNAILVEKKGWDFWGKYQYPKKAQRRLIISFN